MKGYPKVVVSQKQIYALCDGSDSDSSESSDSEEEIIVRRKKTPIYKQKKNGKYIDI